MKTLETIDLSNNGEGVYKHIHNSIFFDCIQFKNVYSRNNMIRHIATAWRIFNKSLRYLDLRQNYITYFSVSIIFFKYLTFTTNNT